MKTIQMIPIAQIRILNARARNKAKFREVSDNIRHVGLKMPITVSPRGDVGDGYDLVCGQGRLESYIANGETEIPAFVEPLPLEERYLRSLIENIARIRKPRLEIARDLLRQKERGHSTAEIAAQVGLSETYVKDLIRLLECGEERLVAAVDCGDIPVTVAIDITSSDDAEVQRVLQAAYESGQLRGRDLQKARRIIEQRRVRGKAFGGRGPKRKQTPTTRDLVVALKKEAQRQELLVKRADLCDRQLRFVLSALRDLLADDHFVTLVRAEKLDAIPQVLRDRIKMS